MSARTAWPAPRLMRGAVVAVFIVALMSPATAFGWWGDHFDSDVSGQSIYESMMIHPEALHRDDKTYVAYQGPLMDPYIVAYDHVAKAWDGPYRIGHNPLQDSWNPLDSHGAPALLMDDAGYLHVFWGAHGSSLQHAKQTVLGNIQNWTTLGTFGGVTYPQPIAADSNEATHSLFYRNDWTDMRGGFYQKTSKDGENWNNAGWVVAGDAANYGWYGNFARGGSGTIHAAFLAQHRIYGSPFARGDVFYMYRDPSDGWWYDVSGSLVSSDTSDPPTYGELRSSADMTRTIVHLRGSEWQNQVVVADGKGGYPGLLYLTGKDYGPTSYKWTFSRWNGASWETTTVADTDHFMDSGALEFETSMTVNAYVTRKGTKGVGSANEQYVDRGGNIEWWQSTDGGAIWTKQQTIRQAQLGGGIIYNDPQVVDSDTPESEARLLFGEWDNDAGNMFHRAFLWGDDGYKQMEFLPDMKRISGKDRHVVSAGISRESFPLSADTVFVASGSVFSDALAGVPLAANYKSPFGTLRGIPAPGPILLVQQDSIPASVEAEIKRLDPKEIVVLGGPATVSEGVYNKLDSMASKRVRRISGNDRHDVSVNIAKELESMVGPIDGVVYANGSDQKAGDALSVSPLAAAQGWPILLVGPAADRMPPSVSAYVKSLGGTAAVTIVGGPASVSDDIYTGGVPPLRLAGSDRYSTSAAIARFGLDGNAHHDPAMTMSRFAVSSGEVFSDALPGGVLEARAHGPVLLTQPGQLPSAIRKVLEDEAYEVDRAYILGGVVSVEPQVVAHVASILQDRQHLPRP